jgi:ATP-binding cassette subfamily A (ABC1) protein 3
VFDFFFWWHLAKIFDDHQGYCHFQIMDKNVSLGLLFGAMENAKKKFNVEDYAIHQATLEQVFLTFKRNHHSKQIYHLP